MKKNNDSVSPETLAKRLRNRIMEQLELMGSFDLQIDYQNKAQIDAPAEVICGWGDWVPEISGLKKWAIDPIFTFEEREAIIKYDKEFDLILEKLPRDLPRLHDLFLDPLWNEMREKASTTLAVFLRRGKISED